MKTTAIARKTVSILQNRQKLPNSPFGTKNWRISEADGSKDHADGSTMGTDTQSIETDMKTAKRSSKLKWPSFLKDGNDSALKGKTCTHRKTHRLNPWMRELEKPPLSDLLRCWADLRTKQLEVGMSSEQATWTAQTAAETSTRIESKQHGWLQKVSKCVTMQDYDKTAYLCRPSHHQTSRTVLP